MKNLTLVKAIIPLSLMMMSSTALQARGDYTESFEDIKRISVNLLNGSLVVTKSKTNKVTIDVDGDYSRAVEVRGNRLEIDHQNMRNRSRRGYGGLGGGEWHISVPDGMKVSFNTASGDLEVFDANIDLRMNTGSGDVDISNARGEFAVNTGSGDIYTDHMVFLNDSKFNTGSGRVVASDITLNAGLILNTGSGNVKLTLTNPVDHDISINSGSGNATLNLGGAKLQGTLVMTAGERRGEIEAPFEFDTTELIEQGRYGSDRIEKTKVFSKKDVVIKIGTGSGTAKIVE